VIDSWDSGDYFQVSFEGVVVGGWSLTYQSSPWQSCGSTQSNYRERVFNIFYRAPHTASTFTMRVISYLDEDSCNESWGFRDVVVIADQNPPPSPSVFCAQLLLWLTAAGVLWDNTYQAVSVPLVIVCVHNVLVEVQQIVIDALISLMLFMTASNA